MIEQQDTQRKHKEVGLLSLCRTVLTGQAWAWPVPGPLSLLYFEVAKSRPPSAGCKVHAAPGFYGKNPCRIRILCGQNLEMAHWFCARLVQSRSKFLLFGRLPNDCSQWNAAIVACRLQSNGDAAVVQKTSRPSASVPVFIVNAVRHLWVKDACRVLIFR